MKPRQIFGDPATPLPSSWHHLRARRFFPLMLLMLRGLVSPGPQHSRTAHEGLGRRPHSRQSFSAGYDPAHPLTSAQRDLLRALVDTDESTSGIAGNWLWFHAAGLPEDREGIASLL